MSDTTNSFPTIKAMLKDKYSDAKKKKKAQAEAQASKDPMKFMKENKNMSIKHLKGVAF
jgi:hypothetical protein